MSDCGACQAPPPGRGIAAFIVQGFGKFLAAAAGAPRGAPSACHPLILCSIFYLLLAHAATTDPRLLDRAWQRYVPTVHELLIGYIERDDAVRAAATAEAHASVTLQIWLDRRGAIARTTVTTPSGVPQFDRAIQTAAERIGVLPDLPDVLLDVGRRDGLSITFGR